MLIRSYTQTTRIISIETGYYHKFSILTEREKIIAIYCHTGSHHQTESIKLNLLVCRSSIQNWVKTSPIVQRIICQSVINFPSYKDIRIIE